jgi:hypothetical protein
MLFKKYSVGAIFSGGWHMGIASVQSGSGANDIFGTQERKKREFPAVENRNTGPDTTSISDEAVAKYQAVKNGSAGLEDKDGAAKSSSLSGKGFNLFSMMLESLFLAELDEAQSGSTSADTGTTNGETTEAALQNAPKRVGGRNPFSDTGKIAELKKIINDFAGGKADLSDLPKAMAFSGGSGTPSPATKTANSDKASAQKENMMRLP